MKRSIRNEIARAGAWLSASAGQAVLGVADQGASSLTNFLAVVVAADSLPTRSFGAFSVAYVLYSILIAGEQSLVGQALVLTVGDSHHKLARARESVLFASTLGVVLGVAVAAAGMILSDIRGPLLLLGLCLPGLFVQDSIRFVASTLKRMHLALLCDVLWLVIGAGFLVAAKVAHLRPSASLYAGCWVASGAIAGVCCLPVLRGGPGFPQLDRFRERSYLGYRFMWEFLAVRAGSQGLTLVLGAMAGIAATGAVRGANTLFGPLGVAIQAISSFGVPIIRGVRASRRELVLTGFGLLLALLTLAVTAALYYIPFLGHHLLGLTWPRARSLVIPVGTSVAAVAVANVAFLALRLIDPRSTLNLRLMASAAMIPLFFAGFFLFSVRGAMWGLTAATAIQAALGVAQYLVFRRTVGGLQRIDDSAEPSSDLAVATSK